MAQNRVKIPFRAPKNTAPINIRTHAAKGEAPVKKTQVRWTEAMDGCLISALINEVLAGTKRADNGFTSTHMKTVIDAVRNGCNVTVGIAHVRSRLKTLKKEYADVHELLQVSGFGFDHNTSSVTAEPSVWAEYVKDKPDAAKLKGKSCLYYEELATIYGNDTANGSNSQSGGDYCPSMEGLVDIDMDEDFVDLNDNDSPETESLNTSPELGKRKASGRLPRPTVEPKPRRKRGNVLEESSRALASIAESSRVIAASMASDANLNALEHVKWQEILDRLKSMELNETDRLRLFSMFEVDHGLAHIFMGITEDAFAKAWAYNKLYAD